MLAQQYNRAASVFSGMILLCLLPMLAAASELTPAEHSIAASVADATLWSSPQPLTLQKQSAKPTHPLGLQTLSIEADWKKHSDGSRVARVYQYDHRQLQSRLLVINVDSKALIQEHIINSVHLPLSAQEISYATAALNTDATVLFDINQERFRQSLEPISDLSNYEAKASIYEPTLVTHPCSTQRCVLFALVDSTLTVSSIEPLVLLSNGQVLLLEESQQ